MTIDLMILMQMVIAAILATGIYTIIGIIPGTDETSVLVPLTALVIFMGFPELVTLSFFIASVVTLNTSGSIPTALTSIPGGVMSTPLVDSAQYLKEQGKTTSSVRKMTIGSLIGTLIAIPSALVVVLIVYLIQTYTSFPIHDHIAKYNTQIFFVGAIILSLMSKGTRKKLISLLAIIPFALVVSFGRSIHPNGIGGTPFFLSITLGPLLASLFALFIPKVRRNNQVFGNQNIEIERDSTKAINLFTIVTPDEVRRSVIASVFASITFFLSPVGMTLLIGDSMTNDIKDKTKQAEGRVTVMNAVANSAYLAGIIISLLAFKIAISPAAMGPGSNLFIEGSKFIDLSFGNAFIAIMIGVVVALTIIVYLSLKYASKMTRVVFKYISQEAVLILLLSLFVLLVYLDAGIIGVLIILGVSLIAGIFNKMGVSYGVQFMAFYAAPFILQLLGIVL